MKAYILMSLTEAICMPVIFCKSLAVNDYSASLLKSEECLLVCAFCWLSCS